MNPSESEPLENEKIVDLGKKDGVFAYDSQWPVFVLHKTDPNGIWTRFKTKIDILEYQNSLQDLTIEEIEEFLYHNSDIDLDMNIFEEEMPEFNFFKYKNEIYCYTYGKKGKDKSRFYVRFYFDLEEIF